MPADLFLALMITQTLDQAMMRLFQVSLAWYDVTAIRAGSR
jgi:hypothetical protein